MALELQGVAVKLLRFLPIFYIARCNQVISGDAIQASISSFSTNIKGGDNNYGS